MATEKYVNPFTDFGFKKIFGAEVNKDLLIDFLNQVIKEQGTITDIHYLRNEQLGPAALNRRAIFDIYCENERGEKFIVEMQKAEQKYFKDRSVYYASFPIQEQAVIGNEWDFSLKAIYFVGILDFVFEEDAADPNYFHHEVKLMDTQRKKVFYDKLTFIYLEMPKFNKTDAELETRFDKWMYVLKNLPRLQSRPAKLQEKVFDHLFKTAEIAKLTPMERGDYEESVKVYRDLKNTLDTAAEKGFELGLEKGMEKGMESAKVSVALQMISDNEPVEKIIKYTGLTAEQVYKLQK